ncbi:MAG TPA: DUF2312 domain-containing protein [Hyphomonadaceae bacterium]|nr:DUF2312 domain-containing protein [Hyphomonadaceae bacterium]
MADAADPFDAGAETLPQNLTGPAQEQLRQLVAKIERLEEEKAGIANDIKEIYAEAKSKGYDVKALRKVISLRRVDRRERAEQEAILDLYMAAIGEA